jgi:hypothetical protein
LPDEESPWYTQLLVSTAVLIGVALLVGGIIVAIGLKAVDVVGLDAPRSTSPENVVIPTQTASSPSGGPKSSTRSPSNRPTKTRPTQTRPTQTRTTKSSPVGAISLTVSPQQVSTYDRINLTGSYPAPDGTTLQVEREESAGVWADFPVTATVNGGTFSTYIETGRVGTNRLRMADQSTGKVSNVAVVAVS